MRPFLRALVLTGLFSCGGATVSSTTTSKQPVTLGDFCRAFASPICNRAVSCQLAGLDECTRTFMLKCCEREVDCANEFPASMTEETIMSLVADCASELATESCSEIAAGNSPSACLMFDAFDGGTADGSAQGGG
jgi:hypothetical protein